ncbi:hypothetical protein C3L33_12641, partial [Rhododendron williamsianum]
MSISSFYKTDLSLQLLGVSQQASKAFIDIMKENLAEEKAFVVTTQFCISGGSPEDISNSLRKLDGLIEKGSLEFLTRVFQDLRLVRMFPDSAIFRCQAALQNAVAEQSSHLRSSK